MAGGYEFAKRPVEPQPSPPSLTALGDDPMTAHARETQLPSDAPTDPSHDAAPASEPTSPPSSELVASGLGTSIKVRPVDAAHGVIIMVRGPLGSGDAGALSRHLHTVFDDHPTAVVVDLSAVRTCDPAGTKVLALARNRARHEGIALYLVHLGAPAARHWLTTAALI